MSDLILFATIGNTTYLIGEKPAKLEDLVRNPELDLGENVWVFMD